VPEEILFSLPDSGVGPEQAVLNAETASMLHSSLRTLSVQHRTVLVLRFFNDLSVPEIAEFTGWREGTVKSQLHRAMAALRDAVAASENPISNRLSGEEV
jgi:RNA polymerase sigma factor (sigma-70 family)